MIFCKQAATNLVAHIKINYEELNLESCPKAKQKGIYPQSAPYVSATFKSLLIVHVATFVWFLSKHNGRVLGTMTLRRWTHPTYTIPISGYQREANPVSFFWDKNQTSGSFLMEDMRQWWK